MGPCFHHRRRVRALPLLAAVTVLTALFSAAAVQVASAGGLPGAAGVTSAVPTPPVISLAPIKVVGGVASVTGTVNAGVNANVSAGANVNVNAKVKVTVNGAPVNVSAGGSFSATVNVAAQAGLVISAGDRASGATYTITIPDSAIPSNGVAADALAQLDADAVTLILPPDGFTIVDGLAIRAGVRLANVTGIAKLTLNGTNLLARLKIGTSSGSGSGGSSGGGGSGSGGTGGGKPGHTGSSSGETASAPVAGNATSVQLTVTGTNGAQQTTTVPVKTVRSVIRIGRQVSISAFGARGIRISAIKFNWSCAHSMSRLGVSVTVRDRQGYLIRDAVVMLQPAAHHATIANTAVGMSGRLGKATFSVPIASAAIGHRLYLKVVARTPRASAHVIASTMLKGGAA